MAQFDPNVWYAISETRVDNGTKALGTTLQTTKDGMRVFPLTASSWQLQPVDGVNGRYIIRNSDSVRQQLTACYAPDEIHPSRTRACMARAISDDTQKWDITKWTRSDGLNTFKLQNAANGTGFVLDVHPGADVFMNNAIEGTTVDGKLVGSQVAQHWVFSSRSQINDGAWSTVYSDTPTPPAPTSTPTGTATSSIPSNAAASTPGTTGSSGPASPQETQPASTGLSSGAAAGIGVGATIAVLAILGTLFFFFWRRRRVSRESLPGGSTASGEYKPADAGGAWPGGVTYQQQQQQQQYHQHPHQAYYDQDPAKTGSPYTPAPYSNTPLSAHSAMHEAPTPQTNHVHEAPSDSPYNPHGYSMHEMQGSVVAREMDTESRPSRRESISNVKFVKGENV